MPRVPIEDGIRGCAVEDLDGKSDRGRVEANASRRWEREKIGRACDVASSASMSDTDTMLVIGLSDAGDPKGTREAEGIRCRVSKDVDDRIWSEGALVVHCDGRHQ